MGEEGEKKRRNAGRKRQKEAEGGRTRQDEAEGGRRRQKEVEEERWKDGVRCSYGEQREGHVDVCEYVQQRVEVAMQRHRSLAGYVLPIEVHRVHEVPNEPTRKLESEKGGLGTNKEEMGGWCGVLSSASSGGPPPR